MEQLEKIAMYLQDAQKYGLQAEVVYFELSDNFVQLQ